MGLPGCLLPAVLTYPETKVLGPVIRSTGKRDLQMEVPVWFSAHLPMQLPGQVGIPPATHQEPELQVTGRESTSLTREEEWAPTHHSFNKTPRA